MPRGVLLRFRRGANTGAPSDLQDGEPFVDTSQRRLYIGAGGSPILLGEGGALTYYEATLSSNITLANANTWYNVVSLNIEPGTWLVSAQIQFWRTATTARTYHAQLLVGSTVISAAQAYLPSVNPSGTSLSLMGIYTASTSTTIWLRAAASAGSDTVRSTGTLNPTGPTTRLVAVKIG